MSMYHRITEWSHEWDGFCPMCKEHKAICPDCGYEVCVFCEDACEGCGVELW